MTTAKSVAAKPTSLVAFAITEAARPNRGTGLYAHTYAALETVGLLGTRRLTARIPQDSLASLIGARAIQYHKKLGNITVDSLGMVGMTDAGRKFFADRRKEGRIVDTELENYRAVLKTGKANKALGLNAKHMERVTLAL